MSQSYSLLDEPWLPVRLDDGRLVNMGLLDVFARSGEIVALAESAPTSLVAQYRLLLAIAHRALVRARGTWRDSNRAQWYRQGLPVDDIRAYLEHWRERFWLFHPDHPFMQVAALAAAEETRDKTKSWTQIDLASASGNTALLFDHARDDEPKSISPAQAVTCLLGFLQFTPGGLVKVLRDSDKAGALANTAAVVPMGNTLMQTLCLCLHPAPTGHGVEDQPAWEKSVLTIEALSGEPVLATGINDRYTRQSRAVLLQREDDGNVRWLRFAAGFALGDDDNAPDPMASFKAGKDKLLRLTFSEGRAMWRDLPALVPNPAGQNQPAAVLEYAIGLHRETNYFGAIFQPVMVAGLASDQAKLLRWRCEKIVLPAPLLLDADKAQKLQTYVAQAERLFEKLHTLAVNALAERLPTPNSKDTRGRARDLLKQGGFEFSYFSAAERGLPQLMQSIADDDGAQAGMQWRVVLRQAAIQAWKHVVASLGRSPHALRAEARHWPRFNALLNYEVPKDDIIAEEA